MVVATNELVGSGGLGEALRQWRGARSIEAMAQLVGVNKNTQGAYERSERLPDLDYLLVFALQTGAPIGELVGLRVAGSAAAAPEVARDLVALLARPHAGSGAAVDANVLAACLRAVDELLEQRRLRLPIDKRARLVALLYKATAAKKESAPPPEDVAELVDLAS